METGGSYSPCGCKVFVVIHPVAGKCNIKEVRELITKTLKETGCEIQVYETTGKENLPDIVREAVKKYFNLFVVAGGDGTVSDVAEGLVGTNIPLGIVPVGTGNVLARELWIPVNIKKACKVIADRHNVTSLDAMQVGNRYYFQTLSAGFASLMIRDTRREHKRIYGVAAYLWTGLKKLLGFQPIKFCVNYDGNQYECYAKEVALMNAGTIGRRPIALGKSIRVDDGKIDICIIRARNFIDCLVLAVRIVLRLQKYDRNIEYFTAHRNIRIETDEPVVVQADGEVIGTTPVEVNILPRTVKIIVPAMNRKNKIKLFL